MKNKTRKSQEKIFKNLFQQYQGTPMAVSSESLEHKKLRYDMLSEVFRNDEIVEMHDVGMGLGAYYDYLKTHFPNKQILYSGSEILREYVDESRKKFPENQFFHRDLAEKKFNDKYDYLIMSGVFHQRRDSTIRDWEKFYQLLLTNSFLMARKGIAFNFVSPFVDFYQTEVYYCNLPKLLNFINDDLSRFFEIRHNYALFEFTIYVYKEEYIKTLQPQKEFAKYFKEN